MKVWKIPVTYQVSAIVEIEAETLEEAMEIAAYNDETIPLPNDSEYVEGSWELSYDFSDIDIVRKFWN